MGADLAAIFNMFLDPAEAMKRVERKWIWVIPTILLSIGSLLMGLAMGPLTVKVMMRNPPDGMTREQLQQGAPMIEFFSKIAAYASPLIIIVLTVISVALVLGACQVFGLKSKFSHLFNLISMASIVQFVKVLASWAVIKLKGDDIQSMQELSPALGLDIFLPDGTNKVLVAVLNYFSVFQIWYIVILALAFAAYAHTSKGKAFGATAIVWVLPLLFVVGGAILRPN